MLVHLVGRAELDEFSVLQDRHAVREVQGLFLVVGHEDGGDAGAVVQFAQPAAQLAADLGVQGAERFVQQQHLGLDGQGARQSDPLALTAGKLRGEALVQPFELHELQQVGDTVGDLGLGRLLRPLPHREAERDVLGDRHVAEQGVVLKHHPHLPPPHGQRQEVLPGESHLASVGLLQPCQNAQQRGLARARRPQQRQELLVLGLQRDVLEGRKAAEGFGDAFDLQGVRGVSAVGSRKVHRNDAIRGGS